MIKKNKFAAAWVKIFLVTHISGNKSIFLFGLIFCLYKGLFYIPYNFPKWSFFTSCTGRACRLYKTFFRKAFLKNLATFLSKSTTQWMSLSLVIFFEFCKVFQYSFFCFILFCFWEYQNIFGWMLLAVAFSKAFLVKKVFL